MALVGKVTQRVAIPHETGEWMELRDLSWDTLQKARQRKSTQVLENMRAMGAEMLRELQQTDEGAVREQAEKDVLAVYDQETVLRFGIAAWSYDAQVSPETIAQLDEDTAAWAARAILTLRQRSEEEQLGNSSPSTSL